MEISITDNLTKNLIDVLKPSLLRASEIRLEVAFAKYSGFFLIEDEVKKCLKNGGKAEFILGLDFRTTEPKVLRILHTMAQSDLDVKLYCFSDPSTNDTPVYHPKIYIIKGKDKAVISIGSSNLTYGGLKDNVEVNVIIEAAIKEEIVSDIYDVYNRLKFQKSRFEPDLEYIEKYEEAYDIVRKKSIEALREKRARNKVKELRERERLLPKPKLSVTELFGWLKLVYEKLPAGQFKTRDIYLYKVEFRKIYPENRNIEAKIRQQLQFLRDMGLVKNPGRDNWEKE